MAPKKARDTTVKTKELQSAETPLMRRLRNIKNAKVQETSWEKTWAEIKEWAYVDKKPTQEAEKANRSSIMNYMNTPFMASFGGKKETTVKFIIIQYHNDRFYFNSPIKISGEVIYKLTGLSNQGDPVPVDIKEGLVERLTGTPSSKNSKVLMIIQIQA